MYAYFIGHYFLPASFLSLSLSVCLSVRPSVILSVCLSDYLFLSHKKTALESLSMIILLHFPRKHMIIFMNTILLSFFSNFHKRFFFKNPSLSKHKTTFKNLPKQHFLSIQKFFRLCSTILLPPLNVKFVSVQHLSFC